MVLESQADWEAHLDCSGSLTIDWSAHRVWLLDTQTDSFRNIELTADWADDGERIRIELASTTVCQGVRAHQVPTRYIVILPAGDAEVFHETVEVPRPPCGKVP